jgi:hypothetical protein
MKILKICMILALINRRKSEIEIYHETEYKNSDNHSTSDNTNK